MWEFAAKLLLHESVALILSTKNRVVGFNIQTDRWNVRPDPAFSRAVAEMEIFRWNVDGRTILVMCFGSAILWEWRCVN